MGMTCTEGSYLSSDQSTTIFYTLWTPNGNPRGIVQIVHGMNEYIGRYTQFAEFLCANGLIVCGNDHIGHGRSASSDKDLGFFGKRNGDRYLVKDIELLREILRKRYPSLPYILFGHSMGSFVARAYITSHPNTIDALILSGTAGGGRPFGLGKNLCRLIGFFCGRRHRSHLVHQMAFGNYNRRFDGDTGYEWVTADPEQLMAYANDPKCTFEFTVTAYRDLFTLLAYVNSPKWYESVPPALPILLFSGEDDPVGDYGNGVRQVADRLADHDASDISVKIYKGERHEVLNGKTRETAYADLLRWIDERINGFYAARQTGWTPSN